MIPLHEIDTVLLDMDGTLLDLHFDNHFWLEHLPQGYARRHGLPPAEAQERLLARYRELRGTLNWYCLDYWSALLEVDIVALKQEVAHLIAEHPGVIDFLDQMRVEGRKVRIVTNAHRASLNLKLSRTALGGHFDEAVSSHDYGYPKEDARFWEALMRAHPFDPARTLLVDDNLCVLRAARDYGIGHLLAVRRPDSRGDVVETAEFTALESFAELMSGGSLRA